ncbi:hypothetical protein JK359_23160 [Streptomyces actinomycinicus]|uniref:Lipoprotein n=1 Tax=Streptomyces actinomycinicus TaxID=1695166 RepID=A0A937ELV1_9ACTN|nr:hypothetical protein [Streptomyces actinomycinicus]MBL1084833.1 hypothetical protein [Streptomyces actinomycinicus]
MTTAGARRKGVVLGLALLAACSAAGCSDPGPGGTAARARTSANPPPPPATTSPARLCTNVVAYWSRRALTGDTYGDYQSMGLSDGQYDILRKVVDAARAARERADAEAAGRLIDGRAHELCEERYRNGEPTGGPWD